MHYTCHEKDFVNGANVNITTFCVEINLYVIYNTRDVLGNARVLFYIAKQMSDKNIIIL